MCFTESTNGSIFVLVDTFTISDLRAKLAILDARIAKAQAVADSAVNAVNVLKTQRVGAAAFLALLEEPEAAPRSFSGGGSRNTGIVAEILGEYPKGIHLKEIERIAGERGHDLDGEQIRSAVTYLGRKGEAERIGRGIWRLTGTPLHENGSANAEPFTLSSLPVGSEVRTG